MCNPCRGSTFNGPKKNSTFMLSPAEFESDAGSRAYQSVIVTVYLFCANYREIFQYREYVLFFLPCSTARLHARYNLSLE